MRSRLALHCCTPIVSVGICLFGKAVPSNGYVHCFQAANVVSLFVSGSLPSNGSTRYNISFFLVFYTDRANVLAYLSMVNWRMIFIKRHKYIEYIDANSQQQTISLNCPSRHLKFQMYTCFSHSVSSITTMIDVLYAYWLSILGLMPLSSLQFVWQDGPHWAALYVGKSIL
jgi:hypothetical protein